MKVLVFFSCVLALVLVSGLPVRSKERHLLLQEMVTTLNRLRELLKSQAISRNLTLKVIDGQQCKPEDFCQVQKVLSGIDHEEFRQKGQIVRQLREYNKHHKTLNCTVKEDTEIPLMEVLLHLRTCLKKKYTHGN